MRFSPVLFAFTDADVWRPGIGDPTVMGWTTVAAYFVAALLCFRCVRRAPPAARNNVEKYFWAALSILLVLLGFNKQLDLQTFLTLTGRRIAIAQGWYEHRRGLQFAFVIFVALLACGAFVGMWRLVRTQTRELWIPLLGFVLLLSFVVVRAASFHHVDTLINLNLAGIRMNWILELGSIGIIGWGACRYLVRRPEGRPHSRLSANPLAS